MFDWIMDFFKKKEVYNPNIILENNGSYIYMWVITSLNKTAYINLSSKEAIWLRNRLEAYIIKNGWE